MATNDRRTQDRDSLARFLGWFSIGLGTMQLLMPKALSRVVGAEEKGKAPHVMRLMGVRELAHGTAILTRARPTFGVWSRVAGDALDLAAPARVRYETFEHKRDDCLKVVLKP